MGAHYDDVAERQPVDHYIRRLAQRARARAEGEGVMTTEEELRLAWLMVLAALEGHRGDAISALNAYETGRQSPLPNYDALEEEARLLLEKKWEAVRSKG